jgi:hypothetical protein
MTERKVEMVTATEIREKAINDSTARLASYARDIQHIRTSIDGFERELRATETGTWITREDQRRDVRAIRLNIDQAQERLRAAESQHALATKAHQSLISDGTLDAFAQARADVGEVAYRERIGSAAAGFARAYVDARRCMAALEQALTEHAERVQRARRLGLLVGVKPEDVPDHGVIGGYNSNFLLARVAFEALTASGIEPLSVVAASGEKSAPILPLPMQPIGSTMQTCVMGQEHPRFTAMVREIADQAVAKAK